MKVIGLGDNVVDRYINEGIYYPGGNAVNFAVYARELGAESAYLGVFGGDEEAEHIRKALTELGVDTSRCRAEPDAVTERCDIMLVEGDRRFVAEDERKNLVSGIKLDEPDLDYLHSFSLIHAGCYAEGIEAEIAKLKNLPQLVSFDFSNDSEFRQDNYLKCVCPHVDFALFSCEDLDDAEIFSILEKAHSYGAKIAFATMGVRGQWLLINGKCLSGKVKLVKAADTMGAGDSYATAFLISLLRSGWKKGEELPEVAAEQAFEKAAAFSADVCLRMGAFGYAHKIK